MDVMAEVGAIGRFLEFAYLPQTAAALKEIFAHGLPAEPQESWYGRLMEVYRREIEGAFNILGEQDIAHHKNVMAALDSLVPQAVRYPERFFGFILSAAPIVSAIGESHGNTRSLYRSFVAHQPSAKHTYLNLALMYLMLCEGVFKNQARLLLGLRRVAEDRDDCSEALTSSVKTNSILEELDQAGLGACGAGYHRHVRNAVAHGYMVFDEGSNGMHLRDYRPSAPGIPTFDETWPFERFARLYAKLDDTYLIVSTYIQVHFLPLLVRIGVDQRLN